MAGLEVLFHSVQSELTGREDAIVCCLHWCVIRQGMKCIGTGDQIPQSVASIPKSEMLPPGWNVSRDVYSLQYAQHDTHEVYLLKIVRLQETLMVHFVKASGGKVADIQVDVTQYTTEELHSYESAYRNIGNLEKRFVKEVLHAILKGDTPTTVEPPESSQSEADQPRRPPESTEDPLRVPPRRPLGRPRPEWGEPDDPFDIGRGDLDPFAAGTGGGMIFDPMRGGVPFHRPRPDAGLPGGLPPGAVPPGARFDPFGPPDLDRSGNARGGPRRDGRAGPDPDHLPPPGYDDMFM